MVFEHDFRTCSIPDSVATTPGVMESGSVVRGGRHQESTHPDLIYLLNPCACEQGKG